MLDSGHGALANLEVTRTLNLLSLCVPCFEYTCFAKRAVRHVCQVIKKKDSNMNVMMTHKAHNGRIICEYLMAVTKQALTRNLNLHYPRVFGVWLQEHVQEGYPHPSDPKLPVQDSALCLPYVSTNCNYTGVSQPSLGKFSLLQTPPT